MLVYICFLFLFFFIKQKTAYEMRISDWSSDVCSSDLTVSSTGNPFSIIMQSKRQFLPSENRTTIVQTIAGRCRANVDVKETDRLKDERTGYIYMIESIVEPQDPIGSEIGRAHV